MKAIAVAVDRISAEMRVAVIDAGVEGVVVVVVGSSKET